ncbi:MAG: HEAT repeat domain-containing protein, partial [Pseudomonadota bacterium]
LVVLAISLGAISSILIKKSTRQRVDPPRAPVKITKHKKPPELPKPAAIKQMVITTVTDALDSQQPRIRALVAQYLGALRYPQMQPALRKALNDDRPEVRQEAAEALGKMGDRSAETVDALRKALAANQKFVAIRMAVALDRIGDKEGVKYLERQLAKPKLAHMYRKKLLEALGELGKANPKELKRTLGKSPIQKTELRYLGYLAIPRTGKHARQKLEKLLTNQDMETRLQAAKALAHLPNQLELAKNALHSVLAGNWPDLKIQAAQELCWLGDPNGIDVLLKSLHSAAGSDEVLLTTSALALGSLDQNAAQGTIVNQTLVTTFIQTPSADLKLATAVALLNK